jgi:tetratricopeptide (TPR) repeat protein
LQEKTPPQPVKEKKPSGRAARQKKPAPTGDRIQAEIGQGARGVVVGKNIVQIGSLVIPTLPLLLIGGLLVLGFVVVGVRAFTAPALPTAVPGPQQMSSSSAFNVAVAEFGETGEDGAVRVSAASQALSKQIYNGLKVEFENLPGSVRQDFQPGLWHDSLPSAEKGRILGVIPGDTPEARETAACALASEINAHLVIFGNLPLNSEGKGFIPQVEICSQVQLRLDASDILGSHQPGEGISLELIRKLDDPTARLSVNTALNNWTKTITTFSIGVLYDLVGLPGQALAVFEQGRDALRTPTAPGSEVLWFFIGRENLILERLDDAQAAFQMALKINPNYTRANIGLGSVLVGRAEKLPPVERLSTSDLQDALQHFQKALELAQQAGSSLDETKARLALATSYLLTGEMQRDLGETASARGAFGQAVQETAPAIDTLGQLHQTRLLSQAHLTLAEAYHHLGYLEQIGGDKQASLDAYRLAQLNYESCIAQQEANPADQVMVSKVIQALCKPYAQAVEQAIKELEGMP